MQPLHFDREPLHALRIEGRKWVNDISLDQAWAILRAAYQELEEQGELLFMMQLPNGEQPAMCMSRRIFEQLLTSPQAMGERLSRHIPERRPGEAEAPLPLRLTARRLRNLHAVPQPG